MPQDVETSFASYFGGVTSCTNCCCPVVPSGAGGVCIGTLKFSTFRDAPLTEIDTPRNPMRSRSPNEFIASPGISIPIGRRSSPFGLQHPACPFPSCRRPPARRPGWGAARVEHETLLVCRARRRDYGGSSRIRLSMTLSVRILWRT